MTATFILADGSKAAGTLSVAQFVSTPVPENLVIDAFPDAVSTAGVATPPLVSFFDVRVTGVTPGATLTVTFHYSDGGFGNPLVVFFDPVTQTLREVHGSKTVPEIVNLAAHTVRIMFDDTSDPAIRALSGTVFTIAVAAVQPAPTTTIGTINSSVAIADTQDVGSRTVSDASSGLSGTTVAFRSSSQATLSVNATQDSSRGAAIGGDDDSNDAPPDDKEKDEDMEDMEDMGARKDGRTKDK